MKMTEIKKNVARRADEAELYVKRKKFRQGIPPINIDKVGISGINESQSDYVRRVIKPGTAPREFRTTGQPQDVTLVPFYRLFDERYAVYWKVGRRA